MAGKAKKDDKDGKGGKKDDKETKQQSSIEVAERPEVVEPWSWFGDWFTQWPPPFGRLPEAFGRPMAGAESIRVEQFLEDGDVVIRAELPGVDPDEDIDVSIVGDRLTISAQREQREESKDDEGFRSEFHYGSFRRVMSLPSGTAADDVEASYHDGILEVRVPVKQADEASTKIPVGRRT
ncbi:MAG: Hsp20/alpha crystallin family protein [Acidimicrobiia bacterium]|nr:Hsp20/alpha crystallin family protein [Acidimicrobiia bacterium]